MAVSKATKTSTENKNSTRKTAPARSTSARSTSAGSSASRSTSTRKTSAKSRSSAKGRSSTSSGKRSQSQERGSQTEIVLLMVFGVAVIMMVSNFGLGGFVGEAISNCGFGLMGLAAYLFPVLLFLGIAFLVSNSHNRLAYKKILAAFVFFIFLCGLIQLFTEGYVSSATLSDYYTFSSDYRTGGGLFGGAICISTVSAFGTVGSYVIIILVMLVCLITITQRSFIEYVIHIVEGIFALVQGVQQRYEEGAPEREMKKEIRAQKRLEAREERMRRLEAEMEEDSEEDDEYEEDEGEEIEEEIEEEKEERRSVRKDSRQNKKERQPFLYGTKLTETFARFLDDLSDNGEDEDDEDEKDEQDQEDDEDAVKEKLNEKKKRPEKKDTVVSSPSGQGQVELKIQRAVSALDDEKFDDSLDEDFFDPVEPQFPSDLSEKDGEDAPPFQDKKADRRPSSNPKSTKAEMEQGIVNIKHEIHQQEETVKKEYQFPPLHLLKKGDGRKQGDSDEYLRKTAQKLQDTLYNFGVNATVTNVSCGPTVTRFELQPEMGVKVSKIVGLADDIMLNLATSDIRIEAPIPGKAAVGIEVPNKETTAVMLKDILQSEEFQNAKSKLSFAVGKDIAGKPVVTDIAKMPHLLIAGATGSGKSVCINTLIMSVLYKASPDEVKLIMIDPKVVELSVYNGIPHLLIPVVTDPKKAAGALNWAVVEMTNRYNTFAEYGVRNLGEYNKKIKNMKTVEGETPPANMPQIVIIVDELADLMMVAPGEVEDAICRLAQLARAAGIHLVIATQRPSVNVITGLIKANMPSRIAFSVSSGVDSRTILDMNGAEKLLGKGDMLFYPQGLQKPARLQGAFVSDEEVSNVVSFLADQNLGTTYNSAIELQVNTAGMSGGGVSVEERDVYFQEAGRFIIEKERASIGMLQRVFKIGFNRAARIMEQLCDAGVVGPEEGTKPRKVLMTMEEFQSYMEANP